MESDPGIGGRKKNLPLISYSVKPYINLIKNLHSRCTNAACYISLLLATLALFHTPTKIVVVSGTNCISPLWVFKGWQDFAQGEQSTVLSKARV